LYFTIRDAVTSTGRLPIPYEALIKALIYKNSDTPPAGAGGFF